MKLGIMQPYLFPYIGYWQLLNYVDTYVIYDDVQFIKGGWINRNYILLNKKKHLLTLPLVNASPNKLINEIFVSSDEKIKRKLLKTIEVAYKKRPYYLEVVPLIEEIVLSDNIKISDLIKKQVYLINDYLSIKTNIILSSEIEKNNSLKGSEKVKEICSILNADTYINAIGGLELYSQDDFKKSSLHLKFLKPKFRAYDQGVSSFVDSLSIIDVLMNNSKDTVREYLKDFEIV